MEKIIEKILDKYYTKKLMNNLHYITFDGYLSDKYEIKDNRVTYYIKPRNFKDNLYRPMLDFNIKESFERLIHYNQFEEYVKSLINSYLEEIK